MGTRVVESGRGTMAVLLNGTAIGDKATMDMMPLSEAPGKEVTIKDGWIDSEVRALVSSVV
jgi:hypothetical protein